MIVSGHPIFIGTGAKNCQLLSISQLFIASCSLAGGWRRTLSILQLPWTRISFRVRPLSSINHASFISFHVSNCPSSLRMTVSCSMSMQSWCQAAKDLCPDENSRALDQCNGYHIWKDCRRPFFLPPRVQDVNNTCRIEQSVPLSQRWCQTPWQWQRRTRNHRMCNFVEGIAKTQSRRQARCRWEAGRVSIDGDLWHRTWRPDCFRSMSNNDIHSHCQYREMNHILWCLTVQVPHYKSSKK